MGITDCGTKVFRHVRSEATLNAYSGKKLAVDVASFKFKAWFGDVPRRAVAGRLKPTRSAPPGRGLYPLSRVSKDERVAARRERDAL